MPDKQQKKPRTAGLFCLGAPALANCAIAQLPVPPPVPSAGSLAVRWHERALPGRLWAAPHA